MIPSSIWYAASYSSRCTKIPAITVNAWYSIGMNRARQAVDPAWIAIERPRECRPIFYGGVNRLPSES